MASADFSTGHPGARLVPLGTFQPAVRVLAVDDSEDDLFFLSRAIQRNAQFSCVARLTSGQEALSYFRREPPFSDPAQFPVPDLVLLDLKMPGVDGFSVLEYLRQHLPERPFKVVVLTSSSAPVDEQHSRKLGADGFETKPADHAGYVQLLQRMQAYIADVPRC